ncbi:MAG: hypothetical protein EA380_10965 [Phycisphaeraceae bacterium]|nr:MAG: hypothetical protein EA380_10965 [Phycisphaeraceae bacterium]
MLQVWTKRLTAAGVIVALAGTTMAAKIAPVTPSANPTFDAQATDAAAQAGTFRLDKSSFLLYGSGSFPNVVITAPVVSHAVAEIFNAPVINSVDGEPVGGFSTFRPGGAIPDLQQNIRGYIATFGRNNSGLSNNIFVDETFRGRIALFGTPSFPYADAAPPADNGRSNTFGEILNNGVAIWRANFRNNGEQNNIESINLLTGHGPGYPSTPNESYLVPNQTNIVNPSNTSNQNEARYGSGFGLLKGPSFGPEGIDGPGSAFLSTPTAISRSNGQLVFAQSTFDGGSGLIGTGVFAWTAAGEYGPPQSILSKSHQWPVSNTPRLAGSTDGNIRFTPPVLQAVTDGSTSTEHIAYGVGYSSGAFSFGGGVNPLYIIVDQLDSAAAGGNGYSNGYVIITADPAGTVTPSSPTDIVNVGGQDWRFVGGTATGSGSFQPPMFDMNSNGDIVIIRQDRSTSIRRYEVVVYPAIKTGSAITGYGAPQIIAETDVDYNGTTFPTFVTSFCSGSSIGGVANFIPFSAPSIDDDGNVAFVGITEAIIDQNGTIFCGGQPQPGAVVLVGSENTLCFYHAASDSLHGLAVGGQNADVLPRETLTDGRTLTPGFFPTDDSALRFNGKSLSDSGHFMAVYFSNGNPNNPSNNGFLSGIPGDPILADDQSVKGILLVEAGEYQEDTVDPTGSCSFACDNGATLPCFEATQADCLAAGGIYQGDGTDCTSNPTSNLCAGDINGDNKTNLDDFIVLAGNFGGVGARPQGDLNCDGAVNLDDFIILAGDFGCDKTALFQP